MDEMERKLLAVVGVGNLLYGDDAVGVKAVWELKNAPLPGGVDVIDAGAVGVGLLDFLTEYKAVVIIDAADMGLPAGTVKVFKPDDVRSLKSGSALSLHSTDILAVIELGKTLGEQLADVHVVAVQPEFVGPRSGLSRPAKRALPAAIAEARRLIAEITAAR